IVPYDAAISPENAHFLYHSMSCEGCLGACVLPPKMGMFPCVARLEGDEIINKVKELLERPAG
ncbi:MAG: lipopolysaccharide heptosyltransferase family protein, partial [Rhodospirillales bacterium]|nr:lipopolysaccharide heptosyltransferase family protein [Rhodospirillales bacterium]